jgi:hypothetical protein
MKLTWEPRRHTCQHSAASYWTVVKVYPTGSHIVLENDAGHPKRFRTEYAAVKAADKLNKEK